MTTYLLDANHLSPLATPGHPLRDRIFQKLELGNTFSIPTPALAEMLFGIQVIPRARQNLREWQKICEGFGYYEVDREDAEKAAALQVELRSRGRQLTTIDALIATVALRYGLTLLTTDQDFNPVTGLQVENWLKQ